MKPLKPGDKVAVYDGIRTIGTVKYMYPDGAYDVRLRSGDIDAFHRKQLRLITKKEKPATKTNAYDIPNSIAGCEAKPIDIPNRSIAPDVKPRELRRVWVGFRKHDSYYITSMKPIDKKDFGPQDLECVEFVEVMKEGGE